MTKTTKTTKILGVATLVALWSAGCGGTVRATVDVPAVSVDASLNAEARTDPGPAACVEQWVHMPIHIGFPTGGTTIDAQNRLVLAEMVRTAQARQDIRRVRVEGHTDSCGNERNNIALSQNRAVSVASELIQMGVPQHMLETVGHGSSIPLGEENCQANQMLTRQVNRRVEFTLLVCR